MSDGGGGSRGAFLCKPRTGAPEVLGLEFWWSAIKELNCGWPEVVNFPVAIPGGSVWPT